MGGRPHGLRTDWTSSLCRTSSNRCSTNASLARESARPSRCTGRQTTARSSHPTRPRYDVALAEWRAARARGFVDTLKDQPTSAPKGKHPYMVEHEGIGLRKVGIAESATRLQEWLRRGWILLEAIRYDTIAELRGDEAIALYRLDQFHARSSTRMKSWFPNLTPDGRTEMFDPTCFRGTLRDLLSQIWHRRWNTSIRVVPGWISEPRSRGGTQGAPAPRS